ncbi:hypothetical protein fHeYen901_85 [Yersinia phage fHe-Yen9-01]|uniref:T4 recombination endonuclease VII dimerisation domain-containing protein n=1 Tax=Yersinia phage fHe-Yen9-01 TaxID=1965363 RepID=A0A1V0DXI2_9CAUD|nr:endonuclease VII [Yersinia phage fHe-Yen9-01]ARB05858.1 hypothetical protein fHeYen901_85 [Yersinia phage fHe-Yen9-01]
MLLTARTYKEEKEKYYNAQNGICPTCKLELDKDVQSNHLDHDHELIGPKAGKIRGLLCPWCNTAEGQIRHKFNRSGLKSRDVDYLEWLKNMLSYLEIDYSNANIHPNYITDKAKEFGRLGKDDMILEMKKYGFVYGDETKTKLQASFKKQLRKSLK